MLKRLFRKRMRPEEEPAVLEEADGSVELAGRTGRCTVKPVLGMTILELAEKHRVDWPSNCRRGTCARCRCLIVEGIDCVSAPNEAEEARLEQEEIADGYRLGCQAKLASPGKVVVKHAPYF